VRKRATTLRDFKKMANEPQYKTPPFVDYEDLERKYWKNLTFVAPVYGADVPGSITDPECKVQKSITTRGARCPFVTSPLGANFDPRGEFCPLGVKLSPGGEFECLPLHSSKQ
jgi:jumonji domain-containing protein 2